MSTMYSKLAILYARKIGSRLELRRKENGLSTYREGIYCGPGWGFTIEDVKSGKIQDLPGAFDAIDQACRLHDQCFMNATACNVP